MSVIPKKNLFHFVALLPRQIDPARFMEAAARRRPQLDAHGKGWTAAVSPRPVAYGPLQEEGGWSWHVVLDLGELPRDSWRIGFGDGAPPEHKAHSLVFLTGAPEKATGLDRARAALGLALAWLDAGASSVAFPSGGVLDEAPHFQGLDPATLDADRAVSLLVSFAFMGKGKDGRSWLRTRGLSQFGLPDLCCGLEGRPEPSADDIEEAKTLFASLTPHVIALDRPLKPRETVKLGGRAWRVGDEKQLEKAPAYLGDLLPLERVLPG